MTGSSCFFSKNETYPTASRLKSLFESVQIQNFLHRHGLVVEPFLIIEICFVLHFRQLMEGYLSGKKRLRNDYNKSTIKVQLT